MQFGITYIQNSPAKFFKVLRRTCPAYRKVAGFLGEAMLSLKTLIWKILIHLLILLPVQQVQIRVLLPVQELLKHSQ